jgi:hypothetical protein
VRHGDENVHVRLFRLWLDALCPRGDGRVLVAGLVRVRHGRGPIGAFLFQVANRRGIMALFSPTMALYPGSAATDLIRAHMELEQQSKRSDGLAGWSQKHPRF